MNLWLSVSCDKPIKESEDLEGLNGTPDWEVNLVEQKLSDKDLVKGYMRDIPEAYDEDHGGWITNIYFVSHEGTEPNRIEILAREDDRLLVRPTGETIDVNYYDDSKPRAKLIVETWFDRVPEGARSMK